MEILNYKIEVKIFPSKNKTKLASVTVIIGPCQIKDFSIRKSKTMGNSEEQSLFLTPPVKKMGANKWFKLFWTDKDTWKEIEQLAIQQFLESQK